MSSEDLIFIHRFNLAQLEAQEQKEKALMGLIRQGNILILNLSGGVTPNTKGVTRK